MMGNLMGLTSGALLDLNQLQSQSFFLLHTITILIHKINKKTNKNTTKNTMTTQLFNLINLLGSPTDTDCWVKEPRVPQTVSSGWLITDVFTRMRSRRLTDTRFSRTMLSSLSHSTRLGLNLTSSGLTSLLT